MFEKPKLGFLKNLSEVFWKTSVRFFETPNNGTFDGFRLEPNCPSECWHS